jgi:RND superfamily putative drug exporter
MREEHVHGADATDAVIQGFRHGARVVTAAGIIMFSVFAGFVASGETIIKSIGFALSIGVLVDAFLIRMTLVPAVMSLLGGTAWALPRWLDRILPDVDVEGEKLTRLLDTRTVGDQASGRARPGGLGHIRGISDDIADREEDEAVDAVG